MSDLYAYTEQSYKKLFGLQRTKDIAFADTLVSALQKIDRGLLPPPATHPRASEIAAGKGSTEVLLAAAESDDPTAVLEAVDALSHIFLHTPIATDAARRLRRVMNRAGVTAGDEVLVAMIAKTLAIGGDEELVRRQVSLLADSDPGIVATAARLLGFARYRPAVPILNALISPDRLYESRYVIWALGEIADDQALPILGYALASGFRVVDCMVAMGKIGDISSIPKLTPMILNGLPEQRDAAYRALAMILNENEAFIGRLTHTRDEFERLILDQLTSGKMDLSGSTRFHMLLCLARLGVKLDPARVRQFLKLPLDDGEASELQSFFARR